jgi:hypothetical protein
VHADVEELRPQLKEILYDCAVNLKATKAALYLWDGSKRFILVTEYGFRSGIRQSADFNDPIIDRCGRGRSPFFINGLAAEPRFAEVMFETTSDRLLVAPVYLRGKLIGVVDMRDKAGRQLFEQSDVPTAQAIAERVASLFLTRTTFGVHFITLSNASADDDAAFVGVRTPGVAVSAPPAASEAVPLPPIRPPIPREERTAPPTHVPRLATLVFEARNAASRIVAPDGVESIGDSEIAAARDVIRSMLLIPGVVVAAFASFGAAGGTLEIAARGPMNDEAVDFLQTKLQLWLSRRGIAPGPLRTAVSVQPGTGGAEIGLPQLQKVFTAPVTAGASGGLYLTVAFDGAPDRATHEQLAVFLNFLEVAIEHSLERSTSLTIRARAADKLLEPDFSKFAELRRHSDLVAGCAEEFARYLAFTPSEIENARLVALLHDVGMRLLDYEHLYRRPDMSADELAILREHVSVGAAVVEPVFGAGVARGVLCHHERVDGAGYPNELSGEEIPLSSRVVQICDVYMTLTDEHSYLRPETPGNALSVISRSAGAQFDPDLAHRFVDFMRRQRVASSE